MDRRQKQKYDNNPNKLNQGNGKAIDGAFNSNFFFDRWKRRASRERFPPPNVSSRSADTCRGKSHIQKMITKTIWLTAKQRLGKHCIRIASSRRFHPKGDTSIEFSARLLDNPLPRWDTRKIQSLPLLAVQNRPAREETESEPNTASLFPKGRANFLGSLGVVKGACPLPAAINSEECRWGPMNFGGRLSVFISLAAVYFWLNSSSISAANYF